MLHDLVLLRKSLLEAYDNSRIQEEILRLRTNIENVKSQANNIGQSDLDFINGMIDTHTQMISQVTVPNQAFMDKIRDLDSRITQVSHRLFANNYELEKHDGGLDHIRANRKLKLSDSVNDLVIQRVNLYTGWQYPALEIGCRDGEWTKRLIASDPLYIMDKYPEFLNTANSQFPASYQQRLRKYSLNNYNFTALPQGQFGFIFSWNHFNYVSLDTITQVLKSAKSLLRPGGVFMFSYNDGDTPEGAGMAENFSQSYIPQSILVPTCLGLGFEVLRTFSEPSNISWIEIKQPGTLRTIKAHQVLGKPTRRND